MDTESPDNFILSDVQAEVISLFKTLEENKKILASSKEREDAINSAISLNRTLNYSSLPKIDLNEFSEIHKSISQCNTKISETIKSLFKNRKKTQNKIDDLTKKIDTANIERGNLSSSKCQSLYSNGIGGTLDYINACKKLLNAIDTAINNAKNVSGFQSGNINDSKSIDDIVGTGATAQVKEKGNYVIDLAVLATTNNYGDSSYNNQPEYTMQPYLSRTNDKKPEGTIEKIVKDDYGLPIIDKYKPKYNNFSYGKYL